MGSTSNNRTSRSSSVSSTSSSESSNFNVNSSRSSRSGKKTITSTRLASQPPENQKPPIPPKPETPNLAQIAHNPGSISQENLIKARTETKPVEDIITARMVGSNLSTGEAIVQDGGGNNYNVKVGVTALRSEISLGGRSFRGPSLVVGQSVVISRSRSQSGERTVRLVSIVPLGQNPKDIVGSLGLTQNFNELCKPTGSGGSSSVIRRPPDPPEDPRDNEDPNPPENPEEDPTEDESDDPPSSPFGCNPNDDARWYNGTSCPAGLRSLGFAELPDGSSKVLCTGNNMPPGDGCPTTPDTYGWSCSDDGCVYVPNGTFINRSECESNCSTPPENPNEDPNDPDAPLRFDCGSGGCVASSTGVYATLEECEGSCGWGPNGDPNSPACIQGSGGEFATKGECELANGLASALYNVRVERVSRQAVPFTGGSVFCPGKGAVRFAVWPNPGVQNTVSTGPTYTLTGPISFYDDRDGSRQIVIRHAGGEQTSGVGSDPCPINTGWSIQCYDGVDCTSAGVCAGSSLNLPACTDLEFRYYVTLAE